MKQAALQGTRLIKDTEMSAGQTIFLFCKGVVHEYKLTAALLEQQESVKMLYSWFEYVDIVFTLPKQP